MRITIILLGIIALALYGCSSPPPTVQPIPDDMLMPEAGMAKFIVYYPYSRIWHNKTLGKTIDVNIKGGTGCKLASGTYFVRDVAPGETVVSASLCNGNGVTRLTVNVKPGKQYYIRIIPKDHSVLGLIAGYGIYTSDEYAPPPAGISTTGHGANGRGETMVTHAEGTAFYMDIADEKSARAQLGSLKIIR